MPRRQIRPRRSALYIPGSNQRALDKARSLPADVLILDLEDAVAPENKALARDNIAAALTVGGYGGREIVVRINARDSQWWQDDLDWAAGCGADAVLLAKTDSPATVTAGADALQAAGARDDLALWAMIETPTGVLNAAGIAGASPRMAALVMGTSDLLKDLGGQPMPGREPLLVALGLSLLAARAHGLAILDGVHPDLGDQEGYRSTCQQGVELGFDGRTVIHPRQLEQANRLYAPSKSEIVAARALIEAFRAAETGGHAVTVHEGRLVERLDVERAEHLLAMSQAITALHG